MMKTTAALTALLLFGLGAPSLAKVSSAQSGESAPVGDSEEGALFRTFGVGMFAASAGDLASTEWGLTHPGIYEMNPLVTHREVRVSAHILVPAAVWWTTKRLREKGHDKAALWVRIGVTAAYGYAVMHNLRTAGSPRTIH